MNFDLSSKITLERIPERYYRPGDAFEAARQTRFEKLHTDIYTSEKDGSHAIAKEIAQLIKTKASKNERTQKI